MDKKQVIMQAKCLKIPVRVETLQDIQDIIDGFEVFGADGNIVDNVSFRPGGWVTNTEEIKKKYPYEPDKYYIHPCLIYRDEK